MTLDEEPNTSLTEAAEPESANQLSIQLPKDNVVSDNLPIYFIWFGSDVPPKYFSNLKRAEATNKSRDIILVYSEKHLLKDNRKNIDSMESISISKIQKRIKLKKDSRTKNLWKIDVYDMELDKHDKRIYPLLDAVFNKKYPDEDNKELTSFQYCVASDIIRLPLLNIIGGIYFDIDTEVTGEIGEIECKNGYGIHFYYLNDSDDFNITGNILVKTKIKWRNFGDFTARTIDTHDKFNKKIRFDESMDNYIDEVDDFINHRENRDRKTDPTNYLSDYINDYYVKNHFNDEYFKTKILKHNNTLEGNIRYSATFGQKTLKIVYGKDGDEFIIEEKFDYEIMQSQVHKPMISDYGIKVPPTVKLKMEQGESYNIDHNNPEQLKKLGLDQEDYGVSNNMESISLELVEKDQEKIR